MNFDEKLEAGKRLIKADKYLEAFDLFCELAYERQDQIQLSQTALFLFDRIVEANYDFEPTTANEFLFRGVSKCFKHEFEESNKDYEKALLLNPNLNIAYYNKGLNFGHLGKFELAIAEIKKAIAMNPTGTYYNELAQQYFELQKFSDCFKSHELAVEKAPHNSLFWFTYGAHLSKSGNDKEAFIKLQKSVELDSKFDKANRALEFVINRLKET
jgi:tetratricopeptide (TPR) repeat protein